MAIGEGFPGQLQYVLPRPLVAELAQRPITSQIMVTDAGYFPHAQGHRRFRRNGSAESIIMVTSAGQGWLSTDDHRLKVGPGSVTIIPAGVPHGYGADESDPWSIWWFHAAGPIVQQMLELSGTQPDAARVGSIDITRVQPLVEDVVKALGTDETQGSLIRASAAAFTVLAELSDRSRRYSKTTADGVAEARDYLRRHFAERHSLAQLADRVALSPSHFAAAFRSTTGQSVFDYVKRLRMARARFLLETTDESVARIGAEVGYGDALYFSRQFRLVVGVSPRAFRDQSREERPASI